MSRTDRPTFPFSAIAGQDMMRLALILNAIDPLIGGVLIMGTRGTAKSTAVRALAAVLPPLEAETEAERENAASIPTPFVNLPVGATEDRVLGTLDLERALKHGEKHFEPGLLARAHRGILYIDEVNLLPDHLVDVILDSVAMGVNIVEREGLSFSHEARVILVGTMNPEEGELRPQLLDRFGLCATAQPLSDAAVRKEAMSRRLAFDADTEFFVRAFAAQQRLLAERIAAARRVLADVTVPDALVDRIVEKTTAAGADGLRADLALHRAARAMAAWNGRLQAVDDDLNAVEELALAHRRRRRERGPAPESNPRPQPPKSSQPPSPAPPSPERADPPSAPEPKSAQRPGESVLGFGQAQAVPWNDRAMQPASASRRRLSSGRGRGADSSVRGPARIGSVPTRSVAFADTLRNIGMRRGGEVPLTPVALEDCRWRSRRQKRRSLVVFVVDASGSMAAASRMRAAKSCALGLLEKAYRTRAFVTLIAFRNQSAEVLLAPSRSAFRAFQQLRQLPAGGTTPLAEGLRAAREVIHRALRKDRELDPFIVLITDGRATHPADGFLEAQRQAAALGELRFPALCIDTEKGPVRLGQTAVLARLLNAHYVNTEQLPPATWGPIIEEWLSWR